jgi:hypothetical protein
MGKYVKIAISVAVGVLVAALLIFIGIGIGQRNNNQAEQDIPRTGQNATTEDSTKQVTDNSTKSSSATTTTTPKTDESGATGSATTHIAEAEAKKIVLDHFKIAENSITNYYGHWDTEDAHWNIEFRSGAHKYEGEVGAQGQLLDSDKDVDLFSQDD